MFKIFHGIYFHITIILLFGLSILYSDNNLVELYPGFDYGSWFKTETGYTPNSQWFGAWVIAPKEDELYFGFATARPAESDGALLAKWVGEWLIPLGQFSEQGVHCIKWVGDTLYGIGSDPSISDGWDGGNFYRYIYNSGEFEKARYNSQKKPVLPNVIHSWGLLFDSDSNRFYMTTGSYDPAQYLKNGGNCGSSYDSTLACFGQVWQSDDYGTTWTLNSGDKFDVLSTFRIYDIIKFNNELYITDAEMTSQNKLKRSSDNGTTWGEIEGLNPSPLFRMCIFKNKLIIAANIAGTYYTIGENNNVNTLAFPGPLNYSFNVFSNVDDRFLVTYFTDGSVYYTSDLVNWNEIIPSTGRNFLSIAYWEKEKSIVLAERGDTGSIWKLDISDLLNTEVKTNSEPEISFNSDNNTVLIFSINDEIHSVEVHNVLGKKIAVPISSNSNNIKLDISQLYSGLYFVCYRSQKNYFVKKIMKF